MVSDSMFMGLGSIALMLIVNYTYFYRRGHHILSALLTFVIAFAAFYSLQASGSVNSPLPMFLVIIALFQLISAPLFKGGGS